MILFTIHLALVAVFAALLPCCRCEFDGVGDDYKTTRPKTIRYKTTRPTMSATQSQFWIQRAYRAFRVREQVMTKIHLDQTNHFSFNASYQLSCTKTYLFTVAAKDLERRFPKITTVCENCRVGEEEDERDKI